MLLATVLWAIAYDTEYAMVDRDDDLKIGVKSSAILFGRYDVMGVLTAHALFLVLMTGIGWWQLRGAFYFAGLTVASALVIFTGWPFCLACSSLRKKPPMGPS